MRLPSTIVLFLAVSACAAPRPAPQRVPQPVDSVTAVATFDSVWSRIANTHYDTAYNGVDWPAVRDELRPRAATARTLPALRSVLTDMLGRLGESHYGIIPAEAADALGGEGGTSGTGGVGLELRIVGDDVLVTRVDSGSAAGRAGIAMGWSVLAIDGAALAGPVRALQQVDDERRRAAHTTLLYQLNGRLQGATGSGVTLQVVDAEGRTRDVALVREPIPGETVKFGNLPPQMARLTHERVALTGGGCAGVIRLNIWMVPLMPAFDRAMDELADCRGVVVDLRGNPGGVAGMVMGVAGHFLNDTIPLGFLKLRSAGMRFKANPRRVRADGTRVEPYAGHVAILTDEMSASTSEFFAAGLQAIGRARVFGSTTAGQALPAVLIRLPSDDVLMHVLADFTGPGGIRIEGAGVRPDEPVQLDRETLLQRRDAALDAALLWIRSGPSPRTEQE